MILNVVKIFLPAVIAFVIGVGITPLLTNFLYRHEMWKKKVGKTALDGNTATVFNELHKHKETGTPRMGGIVIWLSAAVTITGIWFISKVIPTDTNIKLDFLSRSQTWLPLTTLLIGALCGLMDDYLEVKGTGTYMSGGLPLRHRLAIVGIVGILCGSWFFFKLDVTSIGLPLIGELFLGWLIIPLFALVTVGIYSGGVIDGLDGLAGGIFAAIFSSYAAISFFQNQINLAALCLTIVGGILAFLWFNIPPARYYMTETGTMALTITLAVVAFMTDSLGGGYGVIVLPLIALPLVITSLSVIIQIMSKKFRGKKFFLIAPIHHHFEALGWQAYKVTMRFWIIGVVCAILGFVLAVIG